LSIKAQYAIKSNFDISLKDTLIYVATRVMTGMTNKKVERYCFLGNKKYFFLFLGLTRIDLAPTYFHS